VLIGRGHCFNSQFASRVSFSLTNQNSERISLADVPPCFPQLVKPKAAAATTIVIATGHEREVDALTRTFSVYRQTEGGTISHGLATELINRDGKIDKIWRGNGWTPSEVTEAIQAENK
jgi:hypothetical protein